MIGPKRLEEITEKAAIAFWSSVAEQLPEYSPNVLDHGTAIVLQWQMSEAIQRFVQKNLEISESNGKKTQRKLQI